MVKYDNASVLIVKDNKIVLGIGKNRKNKKKLIGGPDGI